MDFAVLRPIEHLCRQHRKSFVHKSRSRKLPQLRDPRAVRGGLLTSRCSTLDPGGVVGTKFNWPDYGPRFDDVTLTPHKEAIWKKWIPLYNTLMLSKGKFLNLYKTGYDTPEGYAIAKDGKMYYAFYVGEGQEWEGDLELRGLEKGKYRVFDYANPKALGTVDASAPRFHARFRENLLLKAAKH